MSENQDPDSSRTQQGYRTGDQDPRVTGVADEVHGAAETSETRDSVSEPTGVQGGEGGGDPAAGAEEGAASPSPKHHDPSR